MMNCEVKIFFNPMDRAIEVEEVTLLLEASRQSGIDIRRICGEQGECGTCKVILNKGEV